MFHCTVLTTLAAKQMHRGTLLNVMTVETTRTPAVNRDLKIIPHIPTVDSSDISAVEFISFKFL